MSSPHFYVLSFATCVDLTQLLSQPCSICLGLCLFVLLRCVKAPPAATVFFYKRKLAWSVSETKHVNPKSIHPIGVLIFLKIDLGLRTRHRGRRVCDVKPDMRRRHLLVPHAIPGVWTGQSRPPPPPPLDQTQAPTTPPYPHRLFDLQDSLDKLMHFLPQLSDFVPLKKVSFCFRAQTD